MSKRERFSAGWSGAVAVALFAYIAVAIGLILAGGLGNLCDRIFYGAVRDFMHMLPGWQLPNGWMWPGNATSDVFPWVFNVADVLLLAGMALLGAFWAWLATRLALRGSQLAALRNE
jgi:lipoprotein signal peptidase